MARAMPARVRQVPSWAAVARHQVPTVTEPGCPLIGATLTRVASQDLLIESWTPADGLREFRRS